MFHMNVPGFFFQTESDLIQFHLANLEYACGAKLSEVSALHWNQNEIMPQFIGRHAFGTEGFEKVTTTLTKELDIRLNTVVRLVKM